MENTSRIKRLFSGKTFTLFIVLIAVVIMFYIINQNYLSLDNIKNILYQASLSGTLVVGIACLFISGNIDLSTGAIGMFGGLIVAFLLQTGMPWVWALLITMGYGLVAGAINAFWSGVLGFFPFISTLAMASAWSGLGLVLTNAQNIAISNKSFWMLGSTAVFGIIPLPFFIMLALFIIYGFILSSTRFGRRMYMCGGNRNAARLAGINPKKVSTILFLNNGAIAALGGAIMASRMHMASPSAVIGSEMDGITAAILGGIAFHGGGGGMFGCFIGLLLLNSFKNGLVVAGLDPYWQIVASGVLLIAALVLDFFREKRRIKTLKARAAADRAKRSA
jgi:ribose transport system permease protein